MRINLRLLLLIGSVALQVSSFGQSLRKIERRALQAYQHADYSVALNHFDLLFKRVEKVSNLYKAGNAAFEIKDYHSAIGYFQRIPFSDRIDEYALTDFKLALAYKLLGEYDRAITHFQRYLNMNTDSSVINASAELEHCFWAREMLLSPVKIKIRNAGLKVNTTEDDLSPFLYAEKLYYTTTSEKGRKLLTQISGYMADTFDGYPNNTEVPINDVALSADGQLMFYSQCDPNAGKCELFIRRKNYEGQWNAPRKLPHSINDRNFTAQQPSIGYDRTLKKYVLYFVSERPGDKGGLDIWASVFEDENNFGDPFPLPFNTPGNDITPYFHQASQTLFFSTDGLPGFGGYDVFKVTKTGKDTWSKVVNLGNPLNSPYDECYYTFHSRTRQALFSSNRPGGVNDGRQRGLPSYDIYYAEVFIELKPHLLRATDSVELCRSTVTIEEILTGQTQQVKMPANCEGSSILLDLERIYRITIEAEGYLPVTLDLNTLGVHQSILFEPVVKTLPEDKAAIIEPAKGYSTP